MLPGLVIQAEPKRLYPAGKAVAHLVGYVGEVTDPIWQPTASPAPAWARWWGRPGWSVEYDSVLRGTPGVRYVEVDARGRMVREEGAAPTLLPAAGRTDPDHDRPAAPASSSTASGRRGCAGRSSR